MKKVKIISVNMILEFKGFDRWKGQIACSTYRGNMVITPDHKFIINQSCLGAKWIIVDNQYFLSFLS